MIPPVTELEAKEACRFPAPDSEPGVADAVFPVSLQGEYADTSRVRKTGRDASKNPLL